MNLRNIFAKKEQVKALLKTAVIPRSYDDWIKFDEKNPPEDVVLAACDTYDCGWTMDTVWWYEDKQCWMTTGAVESTEAHLPYTHWRRLPSYPNEV